MFVFKNLPLLVFAAFALCLVPVSDIEAGSPAPAPISASPAGGTIELGQTICVSNHTGTPLPITFKLNGVPASSGVIPPFGGTVCAPVPMLPGLVGAKVTVCVDGKQTGFCWEIVRPAQ